MASRVRGREPVMRQYRQMRATWAGDAVELISDLTTPPTVLL
jgi:hypothetical protein